MSELDFRGAPTLPLVVLPASGRLALPSSDAGVAGEELAGARGALVGLRAALRGSPRRGRGEDLLRPAADRLGALAHGLAPHLVDPAPLEDDRRDPHDVYMGVRRRDLSPTAALAEVAVVLFRVFTDLRHAWVDVNDVLAEVEGALELLARHGCAVVQEDVPGPPLAAHAHHRANHVVGGSEIERWVLGHHYYAVLHLAVAGLLDDVVGHVRQGACRPAASALDRATVLLRASTAAMAHTGSVSTLRYNEAVRPTMHPPRAPMALGGSMNRDNATLRAAIERLLAVLGSPYDHLAGWDRELAAARHRFLAADLADADRHVTVAAALVGDERSLLQRPDASTNAVGILRNARRRRCDRYSPMLQFDPEGRRRPVGAALA